LAVDILAGVGIIALTIVNPVAGAVAAGAYTAYSAANAATGKNIITGRSIVFCNPVLTANFSPPLKPNFIKLFPAPLRKPIPGKSKEERIMEGLSLIPLPGMGFLKGAGKSLMTIPGNGISESPSMMRSSLDSFLPVIIFFPVAALAKGGEKFAVKTGLQKTMQQAVSRISPKMGMMKNSVLNQSRNLNGCAISLSSPLFTIRLTFCACCPIQFLLC
jgi:predicted ribonuclease toxin of YeeF-YezG toxin-antitoxin module